MEWLPKVASLRTLGLEAKSGELFLDIIWRILSGQTPCITSETNSMYVWLEIRHEEENALVGFHCSSCIPGYARSLLNDLCWRDHNSIAGWKGNQDSMRRSLQLFLFQQWMKLTFENKLEFGRKKDHDLLLRRFPE